MIGVFDSGVGGLVSYGELRRLLPREDIIYLADRRNAPYGTKDKEELIRLVRADLKRLKELGAEEILVACCTASTVCPLLPKEETERLVTIIQPTANRLLDLEKRNDSAVRAAVIATEHTVKVKAFSNEISKRLPRALVTEIPAQKLVSFVEEGARDGNLRADAEEYLDRLLYKVSLRDPEYVLLGCTHFSHLEEEIGKRLPGVKILNPAKLGAMTLSELIKAKNKKHGSGKSLYTE